MPRAASPRRYAQAVFQIARSSDQLETWSEDLRVIATALDNAELSSLLDSPLVPATVKIDTIGQVLGDSVGQLALNLLSILAIRGRSHLIPGILDEYGRLRDLHDGIEPAEVITAVPLDAGQLSRIAELLEGLFGRVVRLTARTEKEVLGGLIARVGNRVIDGSVRARLRDLRRSVVERV